VTSSTNLRLHLYDRTEAFGKDTRQMRPPLWPATGVSNAKRLRANAEPKACFQGQNHGHEGFLLTPEWALGLFEENVKYREVVLPFLTADDMLSAFPAAPKHYVIDFQPRDMRAAAKYATPFAIIRKLVLPDRQKAAEQERERNSQALGDDPHARVDCHHRRILKQWWLLTWPGEEMIQRINRLPRYMACGQVGNRPIFEFVSSNVRPSAACSVFPFADDYSFGILQSDVWRTWFTARHYSIGECLRHLAGAAFETFPWPQSADLSNVLRVAKASRRLRALRHKYMEEGGLSLRELYGSVEPQGENPLEQAHEELDKAVRAAYKMRGRRDTFTALLDLNLKLASREAAGARIQGPGLPRIIGDLDDLSSTDGSEIQCLRGLDMASAGHADGNSTVRTMNAAR